MAAPSSPLPSVEKLEEIIDKSMAEPLTEPMIAKMLEALTEQNKNLASILEVMSRIEKTSQHSSNKLSAMEARQCESTGAGTDSSRFADAWSRAQSAHLHDAQWSELVDRCLESKSLECLKYSELFRAKDIRRSEAMAVFGQALTKPRAST